MTAPLKGKAAIEPVDPKPATVLFADPASTKPGLDAVAAQLRKQDEESCLFKTSKAGA